MAELTLPRIVMLGPQGAGKGTQGVILSHRFRIPHISTGDMLRDQMAARTPLGQQIKEKMDSGQLVTDEEIDEALKVRLSARDCQAGWILDGYPRRMSQVQTLDSFCPPTLAVRLQISDQLATERMLNRRICANGHVYNIRWAWPKDGLCGYCHFPLVQRPEDNLEGISRRLRQYRTLAGPIDNHYGSRGILLTLNGSPPIAAVTKAMLMHLTTGPWLSPKVWRH